LTVHASAGGDKNFAFTFNFHETWLFGKNLAEHYSLNLFLRSTAATAVARLSHRNSVCPFVCPSVCHTGGSVKNGAS